MAASYTFDDLSGAGASQSGNPYDGLIDACGNDPVGHGDSGATSKHILTPRTVSDSRPLRDTPGDARHAAESAAAISRVHRGDHRRNAAEVGDRAWLCRYKKLPGVLGQADTGSQKPHSDDTAATARGRPKYADTTNHEVEFVLITSQNYG